MVKQMQIDLSKKNSEKVLSGAKWISALGQNHFASLNNNNIKPTSSAKKLTNAFLLIPIIIPAAIMVACTICTYLFFNAANTQKNDSILSKMIKPIVQIFIGIAAIIILTSCITSNMMILLIPALIFYCINKDSLYPSNIGALSLEDEEYKKCIKEEVGKLEQQKIKTTRIIYRVVKDKETVDADNEMEDGKKAIMADKDDRNVAIKGTIIDRTILAKITDGRGVIRAVEDDRNMAIKGIIAADEYQSFATGFGLQCSLIEDGGIDFRCGLSTRTGADRKQVIERLRENESVRTLLSGDDGVLSVEQLGSSQRK